MRVSMVFRDEINYEKISQINKKERKNSKLIILDPGFYNALITHLNSLQEEYNKKYSENPTSTEALLLNNEICKLDGMIKEIYNRRERKILLSALDHGLKIETKNLLEHEQKLYNQIVKILKEFRHETLFQKSDPSCDELDHIIEKDVNFQNGDSNNDTKILKESFELSTNDKKIEKPQIISKSGSQSENNRKDIELEVNDSKIGSKLVIVHVLEDIEPFVGPDLTTYDLNKEDLATIPKEIAEILKKNNKVSFIKPSV